MKSASGGHFCFAKTGHYRFAATNVVQAKLKCPGASKVEMSGFPVSFQLYLICFWGSRRAL
ncbi:hypothetical protein, partial [Cupriavidus oxalaticus]|uniref:hypothetical protein n=1 Tax=Cupriavidus oxalaticus TaxID=96344 RepID=UPI003178BF45